uniref:FERM domain-containing protein n=1 Tax=Amphiprion ocellaris TaxID=80972 RepID=A0A3Q1B9T9_AMPOC
MSRSPLRGVKKVKIMQCKITLLDGSDYTLNVEKRVKGHVLFDKVCDHLNLLEKDYFGITYRDMENQKNWLDPSKELKKQIRTGPWNFAFNVKFYPPDPSQLTEDITRYYLCLQLRDDVVSGRLPCSFATHTVLGSYTVQSELGDYDPEELASDYISELRFAPNQTKELEEKVMELHKTYKGMTPAEAEMHFLENAKKLSMYGVDLHHAKDSEGVEIMLGVCASGLLIYRDRLRINRFAWPKILKISYKRNNFYIKIRPGEFEQFESTIGFKLPNHRAAKRLWKVCVEHHTFFRLVSPEAPPKKFLSLGSKFRYSGRTQAQTRRASSQIIRPAPFFERSSSKRYNMSRSLDGAPIMENHETLMKDNAAAKVIAKGDIITTVTTEKKVEEDKSEQEDTHKDAAETPEAAATTPLRQDTKTDSEQTDFAFDGDITATEYSFIRRVKGENVFIKHSNLMLEDTEPSADAVKHQTNISEMKRSFLETGGSTPGLTEWEKRLSSSPVHSPRAHEAPMIEPLEPQDVSYAEDKEDTEGKEMSTLDEKEKSVVPREHETDKNDMLPASMGKEMFKADTSVLTEAQTTEVKMLSTKMEIKTDDMIPLKGIDSPKKAMASWISEEVKTEASEVISVAAKEMKTSDGLKENAEIFTFEDIQSEQSESNLVQNTQQFSFCCPLHISTTTCCLPSFPPAAAKPSPDIVEVATKDMPVVHTETKTITYEAAEVDTNGDADPGVLLSAQTITSETTSTTTTTHITKTVKGGISETRIEKRIVITGDADIDHDEALAQAIKEAKEQHPDMSVTKVVVHKETEITPEEGED